MSSNPGQDITNDISSSIHSVIRRKICPSSPVERRSSSSRRLRIPDKPKSQNLSIWGFVKGFVGKDISHLSLPINFNEPLSLLQRITEELEYGELLDKAASCTCPYEQLAYLAVFIISGYSSSTRITKPFRPLLGETFEFDRTDDLGWRILSEQISHRPPKMAHHCEGNGWNFSQEFSFETKFIGNDIQVIPTGEAYVDFKGGNSYKWNKILTTVHNFILGSVWIDHVGVVEIIGRGKTEGIICKLEFIPYAGNSMWKIARKDVRKVKGEVLDVNGIKKWKIEGSCDDQVEISKVLGEENNALLYDQPRLAWKCNVLPDGSENYYSFSTFACQLNEPEEGVAPTDSRYRPDQRFMEEGNWDAANNEKIRLEEKQRQTLKTRLENEDSEMNVHHPVWFNPVVRDDGSLIHKFNGQYWIRKEEQDWSKCPDIF